MNTDQALPHMRRAAPDVSHHRADIAMRLRRYADVVESGNQLSMFEVARLLSPLATETYRAAQSWSYVHDVAH